jgi:hypothetical protein
MTILASVLDVIAVSLLVHTLVNAALLRRPPRDAIVEETVSVLLPLRDEAQRVAACLEALLAQRGLSEWELLCYDDESRDGTVDVVRRLGRGCVRMIPTAPLPEGWVGKSHACAQLAAVASGSVLVFVDADVVLTPDAIAGAVRLLRDQRLAFVSPYPRQLSGSWLERLVQPLLVWSWLTFLPVRLAARSSRPSLAAANGQLLVVDAGCYRAAGGHATVRDDVVEDIALARALVQAGGRGGFADGHAIAACRMYDGGRDLVAGYAKSLWCAFGSPAGGVTVATLLMLLGVLPWLLLAWTPIAWPAALAGPVGRVVAAARSGDRPVAAGILHPLSVLAFTALLGMSIRRHRRGATTWKGRLVG